MIASDVVTLLHLFRTLQCSCARRGAGRVHASSGTAHDGVIAALDTAVGEILDTLESEGMADNTLVVFANDNGGKKDYGNDPFRGNKATFYEGGIRVPFALKWPGKIEAGSLCHEMVSTLDLLPTFSAVAGIELPVDLVLDGQNLMPFLDGSATGLRQTHFWRNGGCVAMRSGDWKLVWPANRKKQRKLLETLGIKPFKGRRVVEAERDRDLFDAPQLYNLRTDIGETTDMAAQQPEQLARMIKLVEQWESTLPKWNGVPHREGQ